MEPSDCTEELNFFPEKYFTRKQYGGTYPNSITYNFHYAKSIILMFTESEPCSDTNECKKAVREAQLKDKESGLPDIRHNFVIGGDGYVYEGRCWMEDPDVPEKHKKDIPFVLSIGYIGRLGNTPSQEQEDAFQNLLAIGKKHTLIVPNPVMHNYLTESTSNMEE